MVSNSDDKAPCGAIFVNTPFQNKYGTATEINLLTKGNKRGKMRQIIFKKSYIVYTLLMLSGLAIVPTANTSSLSYQTDVGVSFTFNPTLSVSISPGDLTISNLTPGTTDTSNEISVNVSTNNIYGYNLYATVGNSAHDNTNLTHANGIDTFTSISTTADLSNLTTENTWGYTYSLDSGTTWSNYNGLPLYSSTGTRLKKTTELSDDTINFKIAAKSSTTQPSGAYSNIINFTAITNLAPITLAEAYRSEGKELYHGYYKMQDMTPAICEEAEDIGAQLQVIEDMTPAICEEAEDIGAQLQVIDIRDDKVYWIAKLADNNCWMTQNLDLDIDDTRTYTHYDTDLGWTTGDETATWKPTEGHSTINFTGTTVDGWVNSNTEPYSANPGNIYYYAPNPTAKDIVYNSLQECINAGYNDCLHYHIGNYYNWSAVVANNNTSTLTSNNAPNSVCSSNWKLPMAKTVNDFATLAETYDLYGPNTSKLRISPIYFTRAGLFNGAIAYAPGYNWYWLGTPSGVSNAYAPIFYGNIFSTTNADLKSYGFPVRCLAR